MGNIKKIKVGDTTYDIAVNLNDYYNKTEVDTALASKVDVSALDDIQEVIAASLNELENDKADASTTYTKTEVNTALSAKQDTLVSGTNIKTINNTSLLGSGNIDIQGGGGKAVSGGTNQNGGNAVQVAGILGFGTNHQNSAKTVEVNECTNRGNIESATPRAAGIVAACNRYTVIRKCNNYGNNLNTFDLKKDSNPSGSAACRIGNITCITGAGSSIYDSANYGDAISTKSGAVAGIVSLVNDASNVLQNVANYGRVITDRTAKLYC